MNSDFTTKKESIRTLILYIVLDILVINISLAVSLSMWYGGSIPGGGYITINADVWRWFFYAAVFASITTVAVYTLFGFYSKIWKYANMEELIKIFISQVVVYTLILLFDKFYISGKNLIELPKRMLAIALCLNFVLFVFSRSGYRFFKRVFIHIENTVIKKSGTKRVMVIGAGFAGYNVVRSILQCSKGYENRMTAIIVDDDIAKNNSIIHGVRVTHNIDNVPRLAKEYEIDEIIIAIPSADNIQLKRIMDNCSQTDCTLKMIPPMSDLSEGGGTRVLRDVKITDLLFRDEIEINVKDVSGYLKGRTVLVTGGGGSIGSELCRQICGFLPERLIIFDMYENNAYELFFELKNKWGGNTDIIIVVGTVCDKALVDRIFSKYKPAVVFHAAAHKHVPLLQTVPKEAVRNNVFGTVNVVRAAEKYGAERFVLLSTDKAVNPTNVMGATKRITEMIIQRAADKSRTKFMAVRFGNVLGSNGSVIHIFQKQIADGGPVTVTHKDVTRFFMTIPEAARLVLQAGGMGRSGSIFVLNMGEPVKINDLAVNLIKLSGFKPNEDIKIVYTGLRPGDKLYEELILDEEKDNMTKTYHQKIFIAKPIDIDEKRFDSLLKRLEKSCGDNSDTLALIKELVPNFNNRDNGEETEILY